MVFEIGNIVKVVKNITSTNRLLWQPSMDKEVEKCKEGCRYL